MFSIEQSCRFSVLLSDSLIRTSILYSVSQCGRLYTNEDVVVLNPDKDTQTVMRQRMVVRKSKKDSILNRHQGDWILGMINHHDLSVVVSPISCIYNVTPG